jgi:hypothetical protein
VRMIDGQHRCGAVVASGITIVVTVARNVPESAYPVIDTGRMRRCADAFSYQGEKNCFNLASAARFLWLFRNRWSGMTGVRHPSHSTLIELLEQNPGLRDSVSFVVNKAKNQRGLMSSSLASAMHYLFSLKDAAMADMFMDEIRDGVGLGKEDPSYLFRERMLKNKVTKGKLPNDYIAALMVKAWNAKRQGKSLRLLIWRSSGSISEPFPEIV